MHVALLVDLLVPEHNSGSRELVPKGLEVVLAKKIHIIFGKDLEEVLKRELLARSRLNFRQSDLCAVEIHRCDLRALNKIVEHVVTCAYERSSCHVT